MVLLLLHTLFRPIRLSILNNEGEKMRLFIEKVEVGAKYEGKIYDYWIYARTDEGKRIKIFDDNCFNLTSKISSYVDALLYILGTSDNNIEESITGVYEGEIPVNSWVNLDSGMNRNIKYSALRTKSGIYLFDYEESMSKNNLGERVSIGVLRYDLVAYQ
jgi:hypothetical protein